MILNAFRTNWEMQNQENNVKDHANVTNVDFVDEYGLDRNRSYQKGTSSWSYRLLFYAIDYKRNDWLIDLHYSDKRLLFVWRRC
jgi:hypothetical protein